MRILYGVVGEGMGHAIRSSVVIRHLVEEQHQVQIMASSRAVDYLSARFEDVHPIHGFHIISKENRVRRGETLLSNVLQGSAALPRQIEAYFELTDRFEPQAVISDFESWSSLYGESHRLPVFSVDNMQIIDRCTHPPEIVDRNRADFEIARAFVRGKLPLSEHFFITTFFYPKVKRSRTDLFPPILRPEILAARPTRGEHLLVYQTAEGYEELARALAALDLECRVYGMRRGIGEEVVEGNLRYRPWSDAEFVADLASARAVIAGGGFTLMGECVFLRKPLLAIPLEGQFEQILNARYLDLEGYGMAGEGVDEDLLHAFASAIPRYEERLAGYGQDGNRLLFETLDEHLDRAAAGMYPLRPF